MTGVTGRFRPMADVTYPGAARPDRRRTVDSHGVAIAVYEWGEEDAPPLASPGGS